MQVVVDDVNEVDKINQREMDITKERIQKILDTGANVVLTTKGIDDVCLKYFVEVRRRPSSAGRLGAETREEEGVAGGGNARARADRAVTHPAPAARAPRRSRARARAPRARARRRPRLRRRARWRCGA